jgi:DNA-binding transcriptional LysR family regulator
MPGMHSLAALTIDDFALFARVAELRNLSAVARERDTLPSQVSRALARIERALGAKLVHRSTHGLSLTEEGEALAERTAAMLQVAQDVESEIAQRRAEPSGLVRVAASPAMALLLLPAVEALMRRHAQLRIDIAADDRLVDIAREGIDIAIRTGEPGADGLIARRIGHFKRVICAAARYTRRHGTPQTPAELSSAGHCLIANTASPPLNRWPFEVDGQMVEVRAAGPLRTDNTAVVLAMGLAGLGIVRLNESVARPHLASGALVALLEPFVPARRYAIQAVMLPDRQRLPKIRVCLEAFAAVLDQAA